MYINIIKILVFLFQITTLMAPFSFPTNHQVVFLFTSKTSFKHKQELRDLLVKHGATVSYIVTRKVIHCSIIKHTCGCCAQMCTHIKDADRQTDIQRVPTSSTYLEYLLRVVYIPSI